jgi:hypothetical protein
MEHIRKPIEEVLLQIIAAKVVSDLEELDEKSTAVDKIAYRYKEFKIATVMKTLKKLQEVPDATNTGISGK